MISSNYEKIKSDLLAFGKKNGACVEQYQRLYKAESIGEVIAVVKDNFWWCAKYRDFADVIMANREQFAEHQIWVNQDVEILEGVGYLIATEGEINAASWDNSTIHAESWGSSTINAVSWGSSTINAESWDTSTINAESCNTSTIHADSYDSSTIHAKSWAASTIYAKSCGISTFLAESWGASTMIIQTPPVECKVHDQSIARYVYANRIVVADDSIKVVKVNNTQGGGKYMIDQVADVKQSRRMYMELGKKLIEAIGNNNYFQGRCHGWVEGVEYQFVAALVIIRDKEHIKDIVPVWWEFESATNNTFYWFEFIDIVKRSLLNSTQ